MKLLEEEYFALIFTINESLAKSATEIEGASVVERNRTGVGFFTTVELAKPFISAVEGRHYWERNFKHKKMPYGGCFMINQTSPNTLEIEAVAFEGNWPEPYKKEDFIYCVN